MKRRILLVDDEVAVLLTMKAVLEISGFEVETAASAREGKARLRTHQYHMVITDMRMESDLAGREVVQAARLAPYHPAVALLTAFPVDEGDWQELGSLKLLLKPMHTRVLLQQIEKLFETHERKLAAKDQSPSPAPATAAPVIKKSAPQSSKAAAVKPPAKKSPAKKSPAKKSPVAKKPAAKSPAKKSPTKKSPTKKSPAKKAAKR